MRAAVFLIFCFDSRRGPEIGHRRAFDDDGGGFEIREDRIAHFRGGADVDHFGARRADQTAPAR